MTEPRSAATLLLSGRILTLDEARPTAEALAMGEGRILAVGGDAEVAALRGPQTEVVSLDGRTVLPGLADAHIHLEQYAQSLDQVDCETSSLEECLERVRHRAQHTAPGEWIIGHGWNQNAWTRYGSAADLDGVAPHHPVYLTAKSLHAAWANSLALERGGIGRSAADPAGGVVQRDSSGQPTGILFEEAVRLVSRVIPATSLDQLAEALDRAQARLWRFGLTAIHDFDGPECFQALQILHHRGRLGLRVVKNLRPDQIEGATALGLRTGFGTPWLRIGGVKQFADGALGPRTAAMLAPYDGEPENSGLLLKNLDGLVETGRKAIDNGLALAIHAIGDRANRVVLDAFEALRAFEGQRATSPLRHRMEHLQLLHPDDVSRAARLRIIASMQPVHATSDRAMADLHWGSRVRYAYAWRSLHRAGTILAFGSDAPVESPNPFWGLHAAITRRGRDGAPSTQGWVPEERVSLWEALRAYTVGPAYAAGMEQELGVLRPGALADMIVLGQDPFACDPQDLWRLSPVAVMTGGQWRVREF